MTGMIAWGAAALLACGLLELRRLRRTGEELVRRAAERKDWTEGGRDPGEAEERMSPAMLEGFDNLMSYTERTAQGKRA